MGRVLVVVAQFYVDVIRTRICGADGCSAISKVASEHFLVSKIDENPTGTGILHADRRGKRGCRLEELVRAREPVPVLVPTLLVVGCW